MTETLNSNGHAFMTFLRLFSVGSKQTIPPGLTEAIVAVGWTAGDTLQTTSATVGPVDVKSSDKANWHEGFTGECKNFSEVKAKGKKGDNSDLSGAVSGATATLYVDKGESHERR